MADGQLKIFGTWPSIFVVFGLLGAMSSLFYQLQAHWFGVGRSPPILATKTSVDQFLYTPFLSNPVQTLAFLWKSEQFSFRQTVEKMQHFRQFYVLTVPPAWFLYQKYVTDP
jgi:hypothetical protein